MFDLDNPLVFYTPDGTRFHEFRSLERLRSWLVGNSLPFHEVTDHRYLPSHIWPGTCVHCGWIHPDTPAPTDCGHSLGQHALIAIKLIDDAMKLIPKMKMSHEWRELGMQMICYFVANLLGLKTGQPKQQIDKFEEAWNEASKRLLTMLGAIAAIAMEDGGNHFSFSEN